MLATVLCLVSLVGCTTKKMLVNISGKSYQLEIAQTPQERKAGLSGRKAIKNNSGMLFLFEKSETLSFWMKDTVIPLQIVFINGCTIVDIQEMAVEADPANPQKKYHSKSPADKAIELNPNTVSIDNIGTSIQDLCSQNH